MSEGGGGGGEGIERMFFIDPEATFKDETRGQKGHCSLSNKRIEGSCNEPSPEEIFGIMGDGRRASLIQMDTGTDRALAMFLVCIRVLSGDKNN